MDVAIISTLIGAGSALIGTATGFLVSTWLDNRRWRREVQRADEDRARDAARAEQQRRQDRADTIQAAALGVIRPIQQASSVMRYAMAQHTSAWQRPAVARYLVDHLAPAEVEVVTAVLAARVLGDPALNDLLDDLVDPLAALSGLVSEVVSPSSDRWAATQDVLGRGLRAFIDDVATHVATIAADPAAEDPGSFPGPAVPAHGSAAG